MERKIEVVVHHGVSFGQLHHLYYKGLKDIWYNDPDFWCYFQVLDELKDMGFYDPKDVNEMVRLQDDSGTERITHW